MNFFRKASPPPSLAHLWYGDVPLPEWRPLASQPEPSEPWASFARAQRWAQAGQTREALGVLREITKLPGLESRHYLQAWNAIRELGGAPEPNEAKRLYGVVVEVHLNEGLEVLAAYADHSARYLNYTGNQIIWDAKEGPIRDHIAELLRACGVVLRAIGPWDGKRPGPPPQGQVRINLLTASGLHFGQGPWEALANDGLGGPPLSAATRLMKALVDQTIAHR